MRRFVAVAGVAASLGLPVLATAWDDPCPHYRIYSRSWLPAEPDAQTLGLFRLHRSVDDLLEHLLTAEVDANDRIPKLGRADAEKVTLAPGRRGEGVADSSWYGIEAVAIQPFEWLADGGRFGGSLRLKGETSAIQTPTYSQLGAQGGFAVEAWFRPQHLDGTLFHLLGDAGGIRLDLNADGTLEAVQGETSLRTHAQVLDVDRWTHVALVAAPSADRLRFLYGLHGRDHQGQSIPAAEGRFSLTAEDHPPELRLVVDGVVVARQANPDLPALAGRLSGAVMVGNDEQGHRAYRGGIAELRLSSQARQYYPDAISALQATAGAGFPVGPPIMRDPREQVLHLPFDLGLEAGDGVAARATPPSATSQLRFGPGVHGRSLKVGPDTHSPVYALAPELSADSFTLAFWFSPADWDNGRRRFRPVGIVEQRTVQYQPADMPHEVVPLVGLSSRGEDGEEVWLFNVAARAMWTAPAVYTPSQPPAMALMPGRWHFFAVVVDHGTPRFYLDGEPLDTSLFDLKRSAAPADHRLHRLAFGANQPWKLRNAFVDGKHNYIDEARLYSRPLTPVEVRNAMARYQPDVATAPLPFAAVEVTLQPELRRVAADVTLLAPTREEVVDVSLTLTDADGGVRFAGPLPAPVAGRTWLVGDDVFVPTENYVAELRFGDGGGGEDGERLSLSLTRPSFDPRATAEQPPFELAYYPSLGQARLRFQPIWHMSNILSDFLATPDGRFGLQADYYGETDCEGSPLTTQTDPQVAFRWAGAPAHNVPPEHFGVVWHGSLGPVPHDGEYRLRVATSGQAKLWFDGKLALETAAGEDGATSAQLALREGEMYPLKLQYGAVAGLADCLLQWQLVDGVAAVDQQPAQVRVVSAADEVLADRPVVISPWGEQLFEVGDLPDGTYRIEAKLPGGRRFHPRWFTRQHFVWEGNQLGITEEVLPPFEPIRVVGDHVELVMRRYRMSGIGLLESVQARGNQTPYREILAAPVRLLANGQALAGRGGFLHAAGHEAVYGGTGEHAAVRVQVRSTIEYDGCMKVELTLKAGTKNQELRTLALDIPLVDELAPLWHVVRTGIRNNPAGYLPAGEGTIWDSRQFPDPSLPGNFLPYVWLGAEERGLAWFADNDAGWVVGDADQNPSLTLHREAGVLTLRIHLVQIPTVLRQPRTIVFGLMASPGKPMPPNWRRILFDTRHPGCETIGWSGSTYWGAAETMTETYPLGADFSLFDMFQQVRRTGNTASVEAFMDGWRGRHLADYEAAGRKQPEQIISLIEHTIGVLRRRPDYYNVYWEEFFGVSRHHPETAQFRDEWYGDERFGFRPSASYIDFQCWYGAEFIRRGFGLYFDNTFPKAASNPFLSTAWRNESGAVRHSARIWWHREYLKRIWVLHQKLAPADTRPMMMFHMTNSHMLPYMTLGEANLDLEWHYGPRPAQRKFSADLLRAQTLGRQTGNLPLALTDTKRLDGRSAPDAHLEQAERTYFGVLAVHEVKFRPVGISQALLTHLLDFGYGQDDCTVHTYWSDSPPVRLGDPRCKWLLLDRDGKLLLLLVTWNDQPGSVVVELDVEALGRQPVRVVDLEHPGHDEITTMMDALLDVEQGDKLADFATAPPDQGLLATGTEWQGAVDLAPDGKRLMVPLTSFGVRLLQLE